MLDSAFQNQSQRRAMKGHFFLSCLSCRVLRRPYRAYSGAVVCRCMFSTDPDAYPRIRNCDRDPL